MRVESGQVIVVASNQRIRRIPASLLALRVLADFDVDEALARFGVEDPAGARNGRVEKRGLDFINWAIREGLVEVMSPLASVWDLQELGGTIGEQRGDD